MIEPLRFDLHGTHIALNHPNTLVDVVITEVGDFGPSLIGQRLGLLNFILLSSSVLFFASVSLCRIHLFSKII
jgi:hypothetical protein